MCSLPAPPRRRPERTSVRYAIDFVGVDDRRRRASHTDWRTFLASEPADRFVSFGRPILAPAEGVVVVAHDGEPDHPGRRSQLALIPYALGQAARYRQGVNAMAGNHVVLALAGGAFVALAHLRHGSVQVAVGQHVHAGEALAECGSSGNSTDPHVHVQVMDSTDMSVARGLPVTFRDFREWRRGRAPVIRADGVPAEDSVVEPVR